jgi:hypothetical protein
LTDSAKGTSRVTDHPLLLTTLVLYSIVLGLPLGKFPPIDWPEPSDIFIASAALVLLVRMVLTFYYGAIATAYPGKLFALEVAVAGLFAWQFRVVLDDRVNGTGSRLWLFYALHLALMLTMSLWSKILIQTLGIARPPRVLWLRRIGVLSAILGIVFEFVAPEMLLRTLGRWILACVLMSLSVVYALGRPWRRFETMESPIPQPPTTQNEQPPYAKEPLLQSDAEGVEPKRLSLFLEASVLVMTGLSVSFVVGSVVGSQYHLELVEAAESSSVVAAYQRSLVIWYGIGAFVATLVAWKANRDNYPRYFAIITLGGWAGWFFHAITFLPLYGKAAHVWFLFYLSSACLAFTSATGVALTVDQTSQLLAKYSRRSPERVEGGDQPGIVGFAAEQPIAAAHEAQEPRNPSEDDPQTLGRLDGDASGSSERAMKGSE